MQDISERIIHRFQNKALAIEINQILLKLDSISSKYLKRVKRYAQDELDFQLEDEQADSDGKPGTITDLAEYRASIGH